MVPPLRHWLPCLLAPFLIGAHADAPVRVDPLTLETDDFARHRTAAAWDGLTVDQIDFTEDTAHWRLYRIADPTRPTGPLWFVPHDDEHAAFEAALVAIRRHGGTIIVVDGDGNRRNPRVTTGAPVDPNRNFHDSLPHFAERVLGAVNAGAWPIIALHTNPVGYDGARSDCVPGGRSDGGGVVSIHFCNDVFTPSASVARRYPFDDDDNVAIVPYRATQRPADGFCRDAMVAADWNVQQERVSRSDGSLSNYAVLRDLDYINFETLETGRGPTDLAAARDRLVWMVDRAMAMCAGDDSRPDPHRTIAFR